MSLRYELVIFRKFIKFIKFIFVWLICNKASLQLSKINPLPPERMPTPTIAKPALGGAPVGQSIRNRLRPEVTSTGCKLQALFREIFAHLFSGA
jgi:hypothetical protein